MPYLLIQNHECLVGAKFVLQARETRFLKAEPRVIGRVPEQHDEPITCLSAGRKAFSNKARSDSHALVAWKNGNQCQPNPRTIGAMTDDRHRAEQDLPNESAVSVGNE